MSLAPYAVSTAQSRGRRFEEPAPRYRDEFERDRDRIVHSTAFRRLMYKTQVFVNHEGDLYRTRLTHSLEVSQVGRTVARSLRLNETLTEAICLAHDLGHTPFGHAGQDVLNDCMREYGGFEHNFQSLRVVDELENRYPAFRGLNLLFETREGILKHCSKRNAEQLGELGKRFIERLQPSLEAQLADLADAIAYNHHDIDDGYRAGLLTVEQLREQPLFREQHDAALSRYPEIDEKRQVYEVIRRMIGQVVDDLIDTTQARLDKQTPASVDDVRNADRRLVAFSDDMQARHRELKQFLHRQLYSHDRKLEMMQKVMGVLRALFDTFFKQPAQMPDSFADQAQAADEQHRARVVADYVAGMTDRFALAEYRRLFPDADRDFEPSV